MEIKRSRLRQIIKEEVTLAKASVLEGAMDYDSWKSTEPQPAVCPTCDGTGDMDCPACVAVHGDPKLDCSVCDGSGAAECDECGVFTKEPMYSGNDDDEL